MSPASPATQRAEWLWVLAALALLAGLALPWAAARLSTRAAVARACLSRTRSTGAVNVNARASIQLTTLDVDPWGSPCVGFTDIQGVRTGMHSVGPDLRDDGGAGDDVSPTRTELVVVALLGNAPLALGLVLAGLALAARSRLARMYRSPDLLPELLRAAGLASGATLLTLLALGVLLEGPLLDDLRVVADGQVKVLPSLVGPVPAAVLAVAATGFFCAFAWRRGLPLEET